MFNPIKRVSRLATSLLQALVIPVFCALTMTKSLTDRECQSLITKAAIEVGVSPKYISTRLLDENDKNDMRDGLISYEVLLLHVRLWVNAGMPDYAHGNTAYWKKPTDK